MTGFKMFQNQTEFEPLECLACEETLSTAHVAVKHFFAAHSSDDFYVDHDEEEMNEDEKMDENMKVDLEKWIQPNSFLTCVYKEWIADFGHIECAYCTEKFQSKIAWFSHVVHVHKIHPDKMYEKNSLQSIADHNDEVVVDNQDKYDDIPVSTEREIDLDPPSPQIPPKNRKRALVEETTSNDSGNGSLDDNPDQSSADTDMKKYTEADTDADKDTLKMKNEVVPVEEVVFVKEVQNQNSRQMRPTQLQNIDKRYWMVFPNGRIKKRQFVLDGPEITDKELETELETDDEYHRLLNECNSKKTN